MSTPSAIDLLTAQFPKKLRLNTADLARVLCFHPYSIRNRIAKGIFPIPTYVDGTKRFADLRDVAAYLDGLRNKRKAGRPTKASKIEAAAVSTAQ